MSENNTAEIAKNFTPATPPLEKKIGGKLLPEEIQEKTQALFNLLVHKVEVKIDIERQTEYSIKKTGKKGEEQYTKKEKLGPNKVAELDIQAKLDLVKKGDLRGAVTYVSGEDVKTRTLAQNLKDLRETEQKISDLTKEPQVVEQYAKFRRDRIDKLRQAKEASDGQMAIRQLQLQQEKMARNIFLGKRQYSPGERRILDENNSLIQAINNRVAELKKDPEVFDLSRTRQLQEYQKGLKRDRFAETPSRSRFIDAVRTHWSQGKKVLLTGATGGGKTELLLHASRSLFNEEAEKLTGHELMTNYEVYGKTKGGVEKGKVTLMFGAAPFIKALQRNVPFIFDEINVVPNKILMRLKTDLNARVGQELTIQEDSDQKISVGDKFAIGATENVKSEKHVEREKLDPALVRMFEPLIIDYFPPEELYDIMLASMMDVTGGVKLSVKDANDTLKSLCDATEWVQKAFLGQTIQTGGDQILEARGQGSIRKPATLQDAVLDPGKALDMLVGWEDADKSGLTFREFLNQRIVAFINNENYPEEDRYYLTEIFALQGFLKGVKVSELRLAGLDQATLDAWSGFDGKRYVPRTNYITAEVVAKLDPYGIQKRPVAVEASDLLDEGEIVEEIEEEDIKAEEAAQKAAQTRAANKVSPSKPVVGTKVGVGIGTGGLSPDAKFKIDALDIQYDPKSLSSFGEKIYEGYTKELVEIAESEPTAIPVILDRLNVILDTAEKPNYYKMVTFSEFVLRFSHLLPGNKPALLEMGKILNKMQSGYTGTDSYYVNKINSNIRSVREIIMGRAT